ncbi:MAG TPA: NUDIX hydrolase [Saprospiraceae bacterium]|nr:NUDIX hydrolase [Saprospiraceae bacterium]HMQ81278.1 NUDIX hydrolase [Saprospiraceae bacterium]
MYKIYTNNKPFNLCQSSDQMQTLSADEKHLIARYTGQPRTLLNYIDLLEKNKRVEEVTLLSDDVETLLYDFARNYTLIEAAGGIVYGPNQQVLLIYRMGYWDLPKGKIEPGESAEEAAIREVEEETGLTHLTVEDLACQTYHTYRTKSKQRILKLTHWFRMHAAGGILVPQTEEQIEKAEWVDLETFLQKEPTIYNSIKAVLEHELQLKI